MIPQLKQVPLLNGSSVATNGTATATIDTLGYDWATIDWYGATAAATNQPTVLKLQEGDTTSSFADIAGFVGGTNSANGFTIPAQVTSGFYNGKFNVDCRARKRYLQLVIATPGAATAFSAVANLGRGEQAPITAAKAGAQILVEG